MQALKVKVNWMTIKIQVRFCMSIGYAWLTTSRKLVVEAGDFIPLLFSKEEGMKNNSKKEE